MRTPRDYVKDMCKRGKSDDVILGVARCTRWKASLDEVHDWVVRRADKWREKYSNNV